ncbi:SGNH/GDSL hydrolase family protein [Halobacillus sp. A5]|uniref:SGNH/GDSL hydrolase family protein n=1 Tax=Halobacillus sp. A5 TaxID=2880263 RepID=UPI0020A659CD|nr:SGNH/GDSL hydrolase family protein [Halobacillus sp. A5]MCP3027421.1 SGNH/GDSL hydrolase family protein [Halobacillus sp. A5]
MKKTKWLVLLIFSLIFLTLIVFTFVSNPLEDQQNGTDNRAEEQTPVEEEDENREDTDDTEERPDEEEDDTEDTSDEEEGTVSDGLREVFSGVIDNARNLFVRDDLEVVAMGDSLTQGVGDGTDNGGYIGILEDNINDNDETADFTIDNFGRKGDRTDQLLTRMESEEISSSVEDADLVLITIGANNVVQVIEENFTSLSHDDFYPARENYRDELEEILTQVETSNPDASIYLIGLYNPFNQYFDDIPALSQIMTEWNNVSEEVVDDHSNASFIPIEDVFEEKENELLWEEDHFHPNEEGYKQMAERVLEYIREEIEE